MNTIAATTNRIPRTGLIALGVIGLFIGPVVLAVSYTLLKAWVTRGAQEEAAIADNG